MQAQVKSTVIPFSFPAPIGFSALTKRRAKLEQSNSISPSEWESLGFDFLVLGADCNAQRCFDRAAHFRNMSA